MSEYRDAAARWEVLGDIGRQMGNTEEPLRATLGFQFQPAKHGNLLHRLTKHPFTPSLGPHHGIHETVLRIQLLFLFLPFSERGTRYRAM